MKYIELYINYIELYMKYIELCMNYIELNMKYIEKNTMENTKIGRCSPRPRGHLWSILLKLPKKSH